MFNGIFNSLRFTFTIACYYICMVDCIIGYVKGFGVIKVCLADERYINPMCSKVSVFVYVVRLGCKNEYASRRRRKMLVVIST